VATTVEYVEYVCEQIRYFDNVRYKKMFGEYMVYINEKPILLVCDNTVYVKILDSIKDYLQNAEKGFPYGGAKEHYILDIDDIELCEKVIGKLENITPLPKKKIK